MILVFFQLYIHLTIKKITFVTMRNLLLLTILLTSLVCHTQDSTKIEAIQLSGVLVTGDSLHAVSYSNVYNTRTKKGKITDYSGFFSTAIHPGDTIVFSSIGYKTSYYRLPDTLTSKYYSLVHLMEKDTIILKEVEIRPWPTYEQFKHVFADIEVPESDLDRAKENIEMINQMDQNIQFQDASLSYKYQMQEYRSKLYYIGQLPPNNLLNPLAWSEFVKAWKRGDFVND